MVVVMEMTSSVQQIEAVNTMLDRLGFQTQLIEALNAL